MKPTLQRTALAALSFALLGCASHVAAVKNAVGLSSTPEAAKTEAPSGLRALNGGIGATDVQSGVAQAQAQRRAGDLTGAARTLSQLVLGAPDEPSVLGEYGKTLVAQARSDDALAFLERAIELKENEWTFHSARGVAFDQKGDYRSAEASYARALALQPGEPSVLSNAALSRMQAGDLDGAERLLLQASLTPGSDSTRIASNLTLVQSLKASRAAGTAPATGVAAGTALAQAAPVTAVPTPAQAPRPATVPVVAAAPVAAATPVAAPAALAAPIAAPTRQVVQSPISTPAAPPVAAPTPVPAPAPAATIVAAAQPARPATPLGGGTALRINPQALLDNLGNRNEPAPTLISPSTFMPRTQTATPVLPAPPAASPPATAATPAPAPGAPSTSARPQVSVRPAAAPAASRSLEALRADPRILVQPLPSSAGTPPPARTAAATAAVLPAPTPAAQRNIEALRANPTVVMQAVPKDDQAGPVARTAPAARPRPPEQVTLLRPALSGR